MSANYCDCPLCRSMPPASVPGSLVPMIAGEKLIFHGYATTGAGVTFVPEFPVTEVQPTIFDFVKADLGERDKKGAAEHGGRPLLAKTCQCGHLQGEHYFLAKYLDGTGLRACRICGCTRFKLRDFLREAYEEALDLAVYLRGALAEREGKK